MKKLTAEEFDAKAVRLEEIQAEAGALRSALREQVDAFGFTPPRSEKSKRLLGAAFAFTLSTSQTTEIHDAEVERLRSVCPANIFRRLFCAVTKYKLVAGATALLADTLPDGAPRNLRLMFSRAVQVKGGSVRLRIEKIETATEATV